MTTIKDQGEACRVTLRGSHTFVVGEQPAAVGVRFYAKGVTTDFDKRATVAFNTHGATAVSESVDRNVDKSIPCDGRAPLPFSDDEIEQRRPRHTVFPY